MKKLGVLVSDETEKKLKEHVIRKYGKLHGRISRVVEEAILRYLEEEERAEQN